MVLIAHVSCGIDNGDASEIRTKFIKKGLEEHGYNFKTISYCYNNGSRHVSESFRYLSQDKNNHHWLKKIFVFPILLLFELIRIHRFPKYMLVDKLPVYLSVPVFIFSRLFKKKIILIVNEFPNAFIYKKKLSLKSILEYISLKLLGFGTEVIIVISREHESIYRSYANKRCKFIVLPILMDTSLEYTPVKLNNKIKHIVYAGAISESNGVELLIESSKVLIDNLVPHHLTIIGPGISKLYIDKLNKKINDLGIESVVDILPPISNNDVINLLRQSDILVIPKLSDQRSIGYIPSKLGDFLFTGRPVICSKLGEISNYVVHGKSGFLVSPDSVFELSSCIRDVILKYAEFESVGLEGMKVARAFDYRTQCDRLLHLL
ncbi:glycosyltransferase [Plesiomonas shigelloides]|uniref:Glycosyltransferase WbuB n=1 Tax=Plesiomonas shigelloides TaxID=703 RepID=A0A4D6U7Q6_PLESH|nr:glycosyltransferase [Plesiomonas shigelloides]QCH03244.1 glycosyltransferase WbuB [Plesiomonas shigelloides]